MPKKRQSIRIPPPKGYHYMPDGSLMKDSKMKKKAPKNKGTNSTKNKGTNSTKKKY